VAATTSRMIMVRLRVWMTDAVIRIFSG